MSLPTPQAKAGFPVFRLLPDEFAEDLYTSSVSDVEVLQPTKVLDQILSLDLMGIDSLRVDGMSWNLKLRGVLRGVCVLRNVRVLRGLSC